MIFKVSNLRKSFLYLIQGPKFYGGAPSTPSETTQTVNQNSIPTQLLPYTQTMMGAAENQIYQKDSSGAVTGFKPYVPYSANASDYVAPFSPLQKQAQQGAANLQTPNNFGVASNIAGSAGMGQLGTTGTAAQFGAQGSQMGQTAANVGAAGGLGYGAQSANLGMVAANQAGQGYNAGANFAQQATDPNAVNAYMSPYLQNVMNQQIGAANRTYDITGTEQQGRATQAGAFGGSREALMAAENERNRNTAIGGIQATGLQNAFTNAQGQQLQAAQLGLQGMNAGNQAIQTGLSGVGQGITGVNAALQGYQQGISGANAGLAGVGAQQAGYAGAGQAAGTLGNLGTQGLAAQTSVLGTQAAAGATQQAQQQQAIDQAVLDYKNAQQQPLSDIGLMSSLIRGTPVGNATQTIYQAQPSAISQIGGLAATGIGAYGALKANGGVIEDKGYANGGVVGYANGGSVEGSMRGKLQDLDASHLQSIIRENESPEMTALAKEVLATKYAKGGIVAFADTGSVEEAVDNSPDTQDIRRLKAKQAEEKTKNAVANNAIVSASPIVNKGIASIQDTPATTLPKQEAVPMPATPTQPEDTILASMIKARDAAQKEADIPVADRVQQQKALEEKYVGKDTETDAYRKSIMDERANAPDEAKRQMYMRLMEFGAHWASTPGAPLVAGMKAITSTLPGVMADTKENKKMMKDLDRSEYLLNHATRLEGLGQIKEAISAKDEANELFMKYDDKIADGALKKMRLDQLKEISDAELANKITTTRMTNAASIQSHQITAGGTRKDNSQMTASTAGILRQKAMEDAKWMTEQYYTKDMKDAKGNKITEKQYLDNAHRELSNRYLTGATPAAPATEQPNPKQEAPSAALAMLKAHPELKEQFKAKFGYLPEGM